MAEPNETVLNSVKSCITKITEWNQQACSSELGFNIAELPDTVFDEMLQAVSEVLACGSHEEVVSVWAKEGGVSCAAILLNFVATKHKDADALLLPTLQLLALSPNAYALNKSHAADLLFGSPEGSCKPVEQVVQHLECALDTSRSDVNKEIIAMCCKALTAITTRGVPAATFNKMAGPLIYLDAVQTCSLSTALPF